MGSSLSSSLNPHLKRVLLKSSLRSIDSSAAGDAEDAQQQRAANKWLVIEQRLEHETKTTSVFDLHTLALFVLTRRIHEPSVRSQPEEQANSERTTEKIFGLSLLASTRKLKKASLRVGSLDCERHLVSRRQLSCSHSIEMDRCDRGLAGVSRSTRGRLFSASAGGPQRKP